jgi:hypothetical protein
MSNTNPTPAALTDAASTLAFVLAGDAIITVVSAATGTRFTFKVNRPKLDAPHFVALLGGPDNTRDYRFLGTIFGGTVYVPGKKSRISHDAPSARAWSWVWRHLSQGKMPPQTTVMHEGYCGRCGRVITTPTSIASGIGPECAKIIASAA